MKKVVILGGGITGLATAFYLQQHARGCDAVDFTLVEGSPRLGGKIVSEQADGFLVEGGPDSFLAQRPAMLELCRTLGLEEQLSGSNTRERTTYVWSRGRLHPMPEGLMRMAPSMIVPFMLSKLISWPGKLRMGMEIFIPRRAGQGAGDDESLAGFMRRRLGTEALDKIAAPLLAGIHAADPETLSLRSTFPMFIDMEQKHGGLLRTMLKTMLKTMWKTLKREVGPAQPPTPSPMFMTLRGGLQELSDAIARHLPPSCLRLNTRAVCVEACGKQYRITLNDGACLMADDIVFTTPADVTAGLLQVLDPLLASELRTIRYVSTATVSLGYKKSATEASPSGSGFLVPHSEGRRITACSWSSIKFADRAPDGCTLLRVFIGGARAEELATQDEAALVQMAREELHTIMGITAEPILAKVHHWHQANPQYELGHRARILAIEQRAAGYPGLHLAGAAYHGSGIPDCIASGTKAALKIVTSTVCGQVREPSTVTDVPVLASMQG